MEDTTIPNAPSTQEPTQQPTQEDNRISHLLDRIAELERYANHSLKSQNLRESLPKPQLFTGKDKSLYPQWRAFMMTKINLDKTHLDREQKCFYVQGYTTEDAGRYVNTFGRVMRSRGNSTFTFVDVLEHMDKLYDDPQRTERALQKLDKLKMSNKDFEVFLSEYEDISIEAEADLWSDDLRIRDLKKKLSSELLQILVPILAFHSKANTSYAEFVSACRAAVVAHENAKVNGAYKHSLPGRDKNNSAVNVTPVFHSTGPAQDSMDWERTNANAITTRRPDTRPRLKTCINEAEFNARLANRACTTCGQPDHMARNCRVRPAYNQPRFTIKPRVAAVSGLPEEVETRNWSTESGNV